MKLKTDKTKKIILTSLILMLGIFSIAFSSFNPEINYQGKLTDSAGVAVADDDYNMEFKLYTVSSGGSAIWTETLTTTNKITVTSGLFSVLLGNVTSIASVDFNQDLYLGVNIGGSGTASWDGEMTPRKQIASVPSAFEAGKLDGQEGSYYLDADNLTDFGNPFYTYFNATTTTALSEGTNLYYTADRFASALAGTTTDAVSEGSSNFYWTQDRWDIAMTGTTTLPTITTLLNLTNASSTQLTVSDKTWLGNLLTSGNTISATNDSGLHIYDNASNGITILDGGNVGIGDTTPSFKLDVAGDIRTTGTLYATSTEITNLTMTSASTTQLTVSDKAWLKDVDVAGTIENGLVGWWSFDEGTGTTIADKSTNGKNGTLTIGWVACGTSDVTDADGNTYSTVEVGNQCWMAENLNVGTKITSCTGGYVGICTDGADTVQNQANNSTIEKYCYGDIDANCTAEGGLYQWDEMMQYSETAGVQGICPSGWHIPTDAEQYTLENYLATGTCDADRSSVWDCDPAGTKMSNETLNGSNSSGFNAVLSGRRVTGGAFDYLSSGAHFWSSSISGSGAWSRSLYSSYSTVRRNALTQAYGFSVRCLQN